MPTPTHLLARLDAIGASLAGRPDTLALLGVGSVGAELHRVDDWSDLDFFAIVAPGAKAAYIDDLSWLSDVAPIAWGFRNTPDGHKVLFEDDVFCEFAVFEPDELRSIAYTPGRVVWRRAGFDADIATPTVPTPTPSTQPPGAIVGEALSNLYVGLLRWHRGERLAAMRMIQVFAVDRLLELIEREPSAPGVTTDPFNLERRIELRHPGWAERIGRCCQGIDRSPESALAILDALGSFAPLDTAIADRIVLLAERRTARP